MATYTVNPAAAENDYLERHTWEEYAEWHEKVEVAAHDLLQRLDARAGIT